MGEKTDQDLNNVEHLLYIKLFIKMIKLMTYIFTICYFLGQFWYLKCDLESTWENSKFSNYNRDEKTEWDNTEFYIDYFELKKNSNYENTVIGIYYSMSTFSTVGFGDYHPRSDSERVLSSAILVFGVSMFSYFMGEIISHIEAAKLILARNEDLDELNRFFVTLKKFNGEDEIDMGLRKEMEGHFGYLWNNDRSYAIREEADISIME
jgi:hypothetical protein